jgi:hypothetical protein
LALASSWAIRAADPSFSESLTLEIEFCFSYRSSGAATFKRDCHLAVLGRFSGDPGSGLAEVLTLTFELL